MDRESARLGYRPLCDAGGPGLGGFDSGNLGSVLRGFISRVQLTGILFLSCFWWLGFATCRSLRDLTRVDKCERDKAQ